MGNSLTRTKKVLMAMTWEENGQGLGIMRYAQKAGWSVRVAGPLDHAVIAEWEPDGIISQLYRNNPELVKAVKQAGVPIVELAEFITSMKVPRILNDQHAVGCSAAGHLLERNFHRLADMGFSKIRNLPTSALYGFKERAEEGGITVETVDMDDYAFWTKLGLQTPPTGLRWELYTEGAAALARWLMRDDEPVAIFCYDSQFALTLVDVARRIGVSVPDQMAVITVATRTHENELADIPVTCVRYDYETQGYLAGATLHRMMRGEVVPDEQYVSPLPVEELESTDTLAVRHRPAAMALRLFRERAGNYRFSPEDAAEELGVSLRTLHRWFTGYAGRSPADYIEERRLCKAVHLLRTTRMNVEDAAKDSGFSDHRQLRRALRRRTSLTPNEVRNAPESPRIHPSPKPRKRKKSKHPDIKG